jgi:hypothetical protein
MFIRVLCLTLVPLSPGKAPFVIKINMNNYAHFACSTTANNLKEIQLGNQQ